MDYLPVAYVFSNENVISNYLLKELTEKGCKVIFVNNKNINQKINEIPTYLFLIQGFGHKDAFFSSIQLKEILKVSQTYLPKTQIILPYVVNEKSRKRIEKIKLITDKIQNRNLGIVYLGEIYGPGMELGGDSFRDIFESIWHRKPVKVPFYDFDFYAIGINEAIKLLIKGIFSYGFYKREIVIANRVKCFAFVKDLQKIIPDLSFITDPNIKPPATISNFNFIDVKADEVSLENTIKWLRAKNYTNTNVPKKPKIKFNRKRIKLIAFSSLIIFWGLTLPFLLLFVSTITLKRGFYDIKNSNFSNAHLYFKTSTLLASLSKFGFIFSEGKLSANIIIKFSDLGESNIKALVLGQKIGDEISQKNSFDVKSQSEEMFLNLDSLYKQVNFLRADILGLTYSKFLMPEELDLKKISEYIANGKQIVKELPSLLGNEKKANYLVLLQDKNELRPTGGFISQVGIFTFDKGQLVSKSISNTVDFDNQLRGKVTPPFPLQKYLGISNWYLRDSNWDPNFSLASQKAEWFLEKETGQNVDGVIAIQSQSFDKIKTLSDIFNALNTKDVQIFSHNENVQAAVSNLNWDGGYRESTLNCDMNCFYLPVGIVEANLGQNKVNPYINRNVNLFTNMTGNNITNSLEIDYTNLSQKENYRDYVRVLTLAQTEFEKIQETVNGVTQYLVADIGKTNSNSSAGVLIQVPAGKNLRLIFTWTNKKNINFNNDGKILFYLRRQPGTEATPTNIRFILPSFLTKSVTTSYNTDLTTDYFREIDFK
jgi:hypothetical protein